jgi:hypothetical protein
MVLGTIGAAFFLLTDPRLLPADGQSVPAWHPRAWAAVLQSANPNPIDAGHDASAATAVGLFGCLSVLGLGLYLTSRRKV